MSKIINLHEVEQKLSDRNLNSIHKSLSDFPHFSLMKDMDKATNIIVDSIMKNEVIYLVGDYDCDGKIATALMVDFFAKMGLPLPYVIPHRFEDGYGLSASVLDKIEYADTIITVDNGIVAFEAAEICKQRDIKLIITDHHTVEKKIPDCAAVVNPHQADCSYGYESICGAQVAFLLCCSIKAKMKLNIDMTQFLDILALAIVADIMPLKNINRELVRKGIQIINSKKREFFKNLLVITKKERFTMDDIAFQVAPRVNACGRLGKAEVAIEAILATGEESYIKVLEMDSLNIERKAILKESVDIARKLIVPDAEFNVIVNKGLHEGVVGIVASNIAEETTKPTLILSESEDGKYYKGSGRGIGSVDIYKLVSSQSHLLTKYGGHTGAVGMSLLKENIGEFTDGLQRETAKINRNLFAPAEAIFGQLQAKDIGNDILNILDRYAPFGEGNPQPLFSCNNVSIIKVAPLGKDRLHVKIYVDYNGATLDIPLFNTDYDTYKVGDKISFTYSLNTNEWNGKITAQLMAKDIEILNRRAA